jgi:hypothetical protein
MVDSMFQQGNSAHKANTWESSNEPGKERPVKCLREPQRGRLRLGPVVEDFVQEESCLGSILKSAGSH